MILTVSSKISDYDYEIIQYIKQTVRNITLRAIDESALTTKTYEFISFYKQLWDNY